jgi:hypothetical protein
MARSNDQRVESAVNTIVVLLLNARHGEWEPAPLTKVLLHYLGQILVDYERPEVGDVVDEIERFLGKGD